MGIKCFNVYYYDANGDLIDDTQIDEEDMELARSLFVEFGHNIEDLEKVGFEEVWEDD